MSAPAVVRQVGRGTRAEAIDAGGPRSFLVRAAVPAGIILPLLITFGIAAAGEWISGLDSDEIGVTEVTSSNAVYWILTFTVVVGALCAGYAQASAMRGTARDLDRYLFPRSWTSALSRWLFYGALTALVSAVLVALVMIALPLVFPQVYGQVDLFSATGARFLLTVPVYAFFACGLAVGLAGVIGHPAATLAALLLWVFVAEDAAVFLPNGSRIQSFLPFLNGVWGTGQDLVIDPPWGRDGALVWFAVICTAVFVIGAIALSVRRRPQKSR